MKKIFTGIALFLILILPVSASAQTLIPGGFLVGVNLQNDTVTVTEVHHPSDLKKGDRIVAVDGKPIHCAQDIRNALENCGDRVTVTVQRDKKTKKFTLSPLTTADGKKLGITLRQGVSGLGTVTFYDPETERYGALGHSVNDSTGQPVFLKTGSLYPASVVSVKKGQPGKPGQLMGQLDSDKTLGTVEKNVIQGIFGKASFHPDEPLPVATADQIHTGSATIRATVDNRGVQEYSVEILRLYPQKGDRTRNMLLQVTDTALLSATGGIVQGMGVSYN